VPAHQSPFAVTESLSQTLHQDKNRGCNST
jgi:hypothetical protein